MRASRADTHFRPGPSFNADHPWEPLRPVPVHRFLDGPAIPSPSRHRLACLSPHRPSGGSTWALCGGLPNGILQDFHPSPVQTRSLPRCPAFRVSAWRVGVLSDLCFGGVPLHGVWRPAVPPPCGSARWQSIWGGPHRCIAVPVRSGVQQPGMTCMLCGLCAHRQLPGASG